MTITEGNPSLGAALKVMKALGLKFMPQRIEAPRRGAAKRRVA